MTTAVTEEAGPTKKRILVIEDEPDIVRGLKDALEFEGFEVLSKGTGAEGLIAAMEWEPDCVLLDLMLPDDNGYRVCETLRAKNDTVPIIILTAKAQESDKIRGLDAGADDYVTKPFSVAELIARINAIFRRQARMSSHADETFAIGAWTINARKHTMSKGRASKRLTFYELEVLKLLRERSQETVSREELLDKVWGTQTTTSRTVDNFIVKLRRKLEEDQKNPRHILTVYGLGYKLMP
jgi:DNA-binding response OmpR family regulator